MPSRKTMVRIVDHAILPETGGRILKRRGFGYRQRTGWGAWIRTRGWRNQNPLPYHLATPHHASGGATRPDHTHDGGANQSGADRRIEDRGKARADDHRCVL